MDEGQLLGKLSDLAHLGLDMHDDGRMRTAPVTVPASWCDYNGHMNVAFYVARFDQYLGLIFERLDMAEGYIEKRGMSHFTVEGHVRYLAELREGEDLYVDYFLLDASDKAMHYYAEMRGPDGRLAATWEQVTLNVDMATRKAAAMPQDIQELVRRHLYRGERPAQAGTVGIRRKSA